MKSIRGDFLTAEATVAVTGVLGSLFGPHKHAWAATKSFSVMHSDTEWRAQLTPRQYAMRQPLGNAIGTNQNRSDGMVRPEVHCRYAEVIWGMSSMMDHRHGATLLYERAAAELYTRVRMMSASHLNSQDTKPCR